MDKRATGLIAAGLAVPAMLLTLLMGLLLIGGTSQAACAPGGTPAPGVSIDPATVPQTTISGYGHEQLVNAAHVIRAGKDLGLSVRDQTIGVMTAMGESSLRILDHGDRAGPDSRGLFQQRDNGAWGSYADRMDPYRSATNFFTALKKITDRDSLPPTIAAHRVQRNADPYHYERYWNPAVAVVEGLAGVDLGLASGASGLCPGGQGVPGTVNDGGWAVPAAGPITSPYGMRYHPIDGDYRMHSGTDLGGGGCDKPIWAAHAGRVTFRGFDSGGNGTITIDHGSGVTTSYLHMYASGMFVDVGDQVAAGQQIAVVGSSGASSGCHLHFAVKVNGAHTDPVPFMAAVGITLG